MRTRTALLFTASAAFFAWPLVAAAQQDGGFTLEEAPEKEPIVINTSQIEAGVGWVSESSYKFGEYSGLVDEGFFAIGNLDIHQRAPYDGESTLYWDLVAADLGIESRSVYLEYGHQGSFRVFGNYDQIPHYRFDDGMTPYIGAGTADLTLPGGWTSAGDAPAIFAIPANNAFLTGLEVKTERMRYGGGFAANLDRYWVLGGSYQHEHKDGTETIAGLFGTNGGNPRAAILPKPIDFTTQDANVNLQYNGKRLQAQLAYNLSLFDNNNESLTWDNAFDAAGGWDPSQAFPGGRGRMALEPDNSAHNVSLSGGYTVNPTTRVIGNFSYGRMIQNGDFLPYTINSALTAASGGPLVPLPRDDLEGDVTTLHGNLNFVTRPTPKTRFKAKYTYDDRDNTTPTDVFLVVPNDTADQGAVDSSLARINRPYSRSLQKIEIDGSYRVLSDTKVTLGYDFETINRNLQEVDNTYENTGRIRLNTAPSPYASGWIEYDYSWRDGSAYVSNEPFLVSHTPEFIEDLEINDPDDLFENNPFLRKFYLADRRQNVVKGSLTIMPHDQVTVGLSGSYSRSDYDNTFLGLTDLDIASATIDTSYMPSEEVTLSAFFTYDHMRHDQTGWERSTAVTPTTPIVESQIWMLETQDQGYTAGAEVEWTVIEDTLTLALGYTYSKTVTKFDFTADPALGALPLPNLNTTLHSIGVRGDYNVTSDVILRVAYRYETYDVDDFALDGVGVAIPRVIGLGNASPNYDVHVVGLTVVRQF